jgi:RNA polymerase sigma-70 factor (ECF subfamily)
MKYTPDDFNAIYHATFPQVTKFVHFKVADLEDAQEIVQNVYLDFYRYICKNDKPLDNVSAYLISMAKNELTRYYKTRSETPVVLEDEDNMMLEQIPDDQDLELEVLDSLSSQEIWAIIETMPKLDQQILIAHYRFDLPFSEIARSLNMPGSTVRSRHQAAIETIKSRIK